MKSSINLAKKHIVVTGATSGIGYELVRQLYPANQLTVIGRASPRLDALKLEFPDIKVFEADLADLDIVAKVGQEIAEKSEAVDILINNAAVQHTRHFLDAEFQLETIKEEVNTNLASPALLIASLLPALQRSSASTILNVNSGLGLVPKTSSAVYCASKGGLNILSQALFNQFEGSNINVAQAFLPLVETRMTEGRGSGKLNAADAASAILEGLSRGKHTIDVGKVKILRQIARISPSLARKIMKRS